MGCCCSYFNVVLLVECVVFLMLLIVVVWSVFLWDAGATIAAVWLQVIIQYDVVQASKKSARATEVWCLCLCVCVIGNHDTAATGGGGMIIDVFACVHCSVREDLRFAHFRIDCACLCRGMFEDGNKDE